MSNYFLDEEYNIESANIDKIFSDLFENVEKIENLVKEIEEIDRLIEDESPFRTRALEISINQITEAAYAYVPHKVTQAIIASEEFNYAPYAIHLINAVERNLDKIIEIDPESSKILANFNVLGDIDLWASCIVAAREELNLGSTRGWTLKESTQSGEEGENVALALWRHKVYGTAREGRTVETTKKVYNKDAKKYEEVTVDETDLWKDKYDITIEARLSFLSQDEAPYWYIINHGNSRGIPGGQSGVSPYPVVYPTRFVNDINTELTSKFKELLREHNLKITEAFEKNFKEYYNIDWDDINKEEGWVKVAENPSEDGGWVQKDMKQLGEHTKAWKKITSEGRKIERVRYKGRFTTGGYKVIGE